MKHKLFTRVTWSLTLAGLLALTAGCGSTAFPDPAAQADVVTAMRKFDTAAGGAAGGGGGGTGWGTLKGRFVYNGTAPTPANIPTGGKDPLCKVPIKDESLVVGSDKGLKNVLIFAVEASRVHPDLAAAPGKEWIFDQKECRFLEHVFASNTKDKFVILNTDNTAHNSNGAPGRGNPSYNVLLEAVKGRYEYQFKNPLTAPYEVTCSIHPWMKAYHIARPDPYFAVTKDDGTFEIPNLPAGEPVEIQVWHEKAAGGLKFVAGAVSTNARGRFTLNIPKDGDTVNLDVSIDPSALP
jgi:hypothetical protein